MPGTVLGSVEAAVNKTNQIIPLRTLHSRSGGRTMGKAITELKYVNKVLGTASGTQQTSYTM